MAEKDILEKILMSYADVFADCENALTYGGEQRLTAEKLQPAPTESFYRMPLSLHDLLAKGGMPQDEMHRIEDVKLEVYRGT